MNSFVVFCAIVLIKFDFILGQGQQSPCPEYFQYQFDGDQWYGLIDIQSPPGQSIRLDAFFSLKAQLFTKYVGAIELVGTKQAALQNIINGRPIRYIVRFPLPEPIPKLTSLVYNKQVLCTGPPEYGGYVTSIKLDHNLYIETGSNPSIQSQLPTPNNQFINTRPQYPPPNQYYEINIGNGNGNNGGNPIQQNPQQNTQQNTQPRPIPTRPVTRPTAASATVEQSCGLPARAPAPLVFGGAKIKRGDWPWIVALYLKLPTALNYHCGGTLISTKLIVTAAHCCTPERSEQAFKPDKLVGFLGRYNILDWGETNYVSTDFSQVNVHRDYRGRDLSFDSDIAILVMKETVTYTRFIQPICLWTFSSSVDVIVGERGTLVGWGRTETGGTSSEAKVLEVPIVSETECLRADPSFALITSNRTFCAGGRNGAGPCDGDSGGGLVLKRNNQWYLRGIISVALADQETKICDTKSFVVYTDTAKFQDWIVSFF